MFGPICLTNPKSLEFLKKTLSGYPQSVLERQQEIDCKSCFFRLFCNPPAFSWLGIKIKGYQRVIYCWVLTKKPLKPGSCMFMVKISPMLQFSNTKESYKMFNHNVFNSEFFFFKLSVFQIFLSCPCIFMVRIIILTLVLCRNLCYSIGFRHITNKSCLINLFFVVIHTIAIR